MATPQFVPLQRPQSEAPEPLSPIDDEPPLRWQRALHIAPRDGLGIIRRAVFFALLTWLPIAIWAFVRGRFLETWMGEPLLQHYGVHVRCLIAIPLLIVGEATLHVTAVRPQRHRGRGRAAKVRCGAA